MWAVSVHEPNHLSLLQTELPTPGPKEVLVRIARTGICGSDIHIYRGHNPFARYPRVIGHEAVGQIEAIGGEVKTLAIGDRVVLDPRAIAFQIWARSLARKASLSAARRSFFGKEPLDLSLPRRLSAMWRSTARLLGPLSSLLRS